MISSSQKAKSSPALLQNKASSVEYCSDGIRSEPCPVIILGNETSKV